MMILSERQGFASDHSSTSYEFMAVDKPLGQKERAEVSKLSSRVNPTSRRANFVYNVDGYDIPGGWENLMARYYDVMYREDYGWWTLAMAFDATPEQYEVLAEYAFDEGEETGIEIAYHEDRRIIITINCVIEDYYEDGDEEDYDDESGGNVFSTDNGLLNILIQIRQQIMKGNYRALDAVFVKYGDSEEEISPPSLKNLGKDDRIIRDFINMLG